MTEQTQREDELGQLLDSEALREWMVRQRWYASKSLGINNVEVLDRAEVGEHLQLVLVQVRLTTGAHEVYQMPLITRVAGDVWATGGVPLARGTEMEIYDALAEPHHARALLEMILTDANIQTDHGSFAFRHVAEANSPGTGASVRALGADQSNSTFVIGERSAVKLFRKVESGINPELEMLRFLTANGFEQIPAIEGWYEYEGVSLASTLGVVQQFVPDAHNGWEMALEMIASAPEVLLEELAGLGRVTAQMHNALASDATDPAFAPEDPINESLPLMIAAIEESIERIFMRLPDTDAVAPIYGRGEDIRAQLSVRSQPSVGGKHIRIHGDYHLAQTLHTPDGWVIIDFEGEPARPLFERRQKRSPLKDVAGLLRSLSYVSATVEFQGGPDAPDGFEDRAREAFLESYMAEIDAALLPAGDTAIANMLAIFELEKAIYELRYELDHRPDWVGIPVAGILRLLEAE